MSELLPIVSPISAYNYVLNYDNGETAELKFSEQELRHLNSAAEMGAEIKTILQANGDDQDVVLWCTPVGGWYIFDSRIEKKGFWNAGDECTSVHRGKIAVALEVY